MTITTITSSLKGLGIKYLEAMAYAEPSGAMWALEQEEAVQAAAQERMNSSRSALMTSACVVGMPCGKPA